MAFLGGPTVSFFFSFELLPDLPVLLVYVTPARGKKDPFDSITYSRGLKENGKQEHRGSEWFGGYAPVEATARRSPSTGGPRHSYRKQQRELRLYSHRRSVKSVVAVATGARRGAKVFGTLAASAQTTKTHSK